MMVITQVAVGVRRAELPSREELALDAVKAAVRHRCAAVRNSSLFLEVSRIIKHRLELEEVLGPLMEYLVRALGFERAAIRVADAAGDKIEGSFGMEEGGARSSEVQGMTELRRWVERTAKPAATLWEIENSSGITLLCVPVLMERRVIGTLCAERLIQSGKPAHEDLNTMAMVASILARGIQFRRLALGIAGELYHENQALREHIQNHFRPAGMAGDSAAMQTVYYKVVQAAPLDIPVLIRGEQGTGKSSVAAALHAGSDRNGGRMVEVDCAASRGSAGLEASLGEARGGSLFLKHVEGLSAADQLRLLKFIWDSEAAESWGREAEALDVRLICSSSQALEDLVNAGRFDRELFFALSAYSIRVPPLRGRRGDILQLADLFLGKFSALYRRKVRRISAAAVDLLLAYDWPGNVAEMRACFEKAVLRCDDGVVRANHFPPRLYAAVDPQGGRLGALESAVAALEYELVVEALTVAHGNIAAAARQLGTTERIMGCRVKKYGLAMSRFAYIPAGNSAA